MAILLQYNHGDNFSIQQLQENTQIDTVILYRDSCWLSLPFHFISFYCECCSFRPVIVSSSHHGVIALCLPMGTCWLCGVLLHTFRQLIWQSTACAHMQPTGKRFTRDKCAMRKVIHSLKLLCSCDLYVIFSPLFCSSNLTAPARISCCLPPTRVPSISVIANIAIFCVANGTQQYASHYRSMSILAHAYVSYGQTWQMPTTAQRLETAILVKWRHNRSKQVIALTLLVPLY